MNTLWQHGSRTLPSPASTGHSHPESFVAFFSLEGMTGFEPVNAGFAIPSLKPLEYTPASGGYWDRTSAAMFSQTSPQQGGTLPTRSILQLFSQILAESGGLEPHSEMIRNLVFKTSRHANVAASLSVLSG